MLSDRQLIDLALVGDYLAFGALVDRYGGLVYSFALLSQPDPGKAEQLTLSTFVEALENLAGFTRRATFAAWILAIASLESTRMRDRDRDCAGGGGNRL